MNFEFDQSDQSRWESDMIEDIYSSEEDVNRLIVLSKKRGDEKLSKNARKRKKRREKLNRLEKSNLAHKSSEEEDDENSVQREHLTKYSKIGTGSASRWLFKLILVLFTIGAGLGLTYLWTNNILFNLNVEEKAGDHLKSQSSFSDGFTNDQVREEANVYVEPNTFRPLEENSRILVSDAYSQAPEVKAQDEVKPYDYSWLFWWTKEEKSVKSEEVLGRSERADIMETENEQFTYGNNLEQSEQITRQSSDESSVWFSDLYEKSHSHPEGYTTEQSHSDFDQYIDSEQLKQARIIAESLAKEEAETISLRQEAEALEETKLEEAQFAECYKTYKERGESIDECKARKISNNQGQLVSEINDEFSSTQSSSPSISMDPKVMQDVYDEDLYYW